MIEENSAGVTIDPSRQEKARQYARISRRLMLVGLAISAVYSLAWLVFGWSATLKSLLQLYLSNDWLLVIAFAAIFGVIWVIINLPLNYYEGFILPHRFGMSNQALAGWIVDQFKGLLVGGIVGGIVLEVIYAMLRQFPDTWWLWAAIFLLVFNVLLANLAPVLLMPIFYKFRPLGEEQADLVARLMRLAERANTHVQGVYQFDMSRRTKAANAALIGLGNTRRIILGDTLLKEFTAEEIETVLAHELGHHAHKDIPIGIAVSSAITLIGLYLAAIGLQGGAGAFGFSNPADIATLPLLVLVIGAYNLFVMPLINGFSRWRERRADQYALQVTQNGAAFASALTKLTNQNLAQADPETWVELILYSHPALGKRIAMAKAYQPK